MNLKGIIIEHYPLFLTMCILLIPLVFASIGSIFCGFNYPNNRWSYVMTFIFTYITAVFINNHCKLEKSDLKAILIFNVIYFCLIAICKPIIYKFVYAQILIFITILAIVILKKIIKKLPTWLFNTSLLGIITVNIILSIIVIYNPKGYGAEFLDKNTLESIFNTSYNTIPDFKDAITYLNAQDKSFYRINKNPYVLDNISLINNFKTTGGYYSLTPKTYGNLNNDLENISYYTNYGSRDFDNRTKINTILGNKYLISSKRQSKIPYGYEEIKDYKGTSKIYQNKYALPFVTLYTNYIKESDYESLNPIEKESALLKTVVLDDAENILYNNNLDLNIKEINYQIVDENNILGENKITIKSKKKNYFKLNIEDIENSEIYLRFENLKYTPRTREEVINSKLKNVTSKKEQSAIKKEYQWYNPSTSYKLTVNYNGVNTNRNIKSINSAYYMDKDDFLFNLGYYKKTNGKIKITLSSLGSYTYSSLKVYVVPMDDYESDILNLKKSNFELKDYGTNYLIGTVNCNTSGILQFATNYHKGFLIYIDNVLVPSLKVNNYFLGTNILKGSHEIKIVYQNPYIKYGFIMSILGTMSLIIITIKRKRHQNKS